MKFLFLSSYAHLILDPASDRVSGGAELQVALLSKELVRRGHEVVVVGGDIGQADRAVFDGVRTRTGGRFHTGGLADLFTAFPRVVSVLREEKPEWVFVLGWTTWLFFLQVLKPFFGYRLGFICGLDTELNGEFRRENPVRGALLEYGIRHADCRFAMTGHQSELYHRSGLDSALYRNLILPRQAKRTAPKIIDLLWVSRCQPIKRPHLFLDLAERLPQARCRMVCPKEDRELWLSVEQRARGLANVEFIERVPYHEIQAVYDEARIFVNTSTWEGWPNSFIQSGLGATALLSLSVNPDDLFGKFPLGRFAAGDFERLAQDASDMVADLPGTAVMGEACARFVRELHDNTRETDAFLGGLPR